MLSMYLQYAQFNCSNMNTEMLLVIPVNASLFLLFNKTSI